MLQNFQGHFLTYHTWLVFPTHKSEFVVADEKYQPLSKFPLLTYFKGDNFLVSSWVV